MFNTMRLAIPVPQVGYNHFRNLHMLESHLGGNSYIFFVGKHRVATSHRLRISISYLTLLHGVTGDLWLGFKLVIVIA
jgi:hypothetical protein